MENQEFTQLSQQLPKKEKQPFYLMAGLIALLVVIVGLQAIQLQSLTRTIKSGGVGVPAQAQASASFLDSLKAQVGGCGG